MDESKLSPMMKQYLAVKRTCEDKILFYRLGDFYEMFSDAHRQGVRSAGARAHVRRAVSQR